MMEPDKKMKRKFALAGVVLVATLSLVGTVFCGTALAQSESASTALEHSTQPNSTGGNYGLIAAAVAFGFGAIGAGIAIGHVGAAAMGAVAEKPQTFGQALIFVALAEGILVFGFIMALMILGKV